jgi:hypothetical protein
LLALSGAHLLRRSIFLCCSHSTTTQWKNSQTFNVSDSDALFDFLSVT